MAPEHIVNVNETDFEFEVLAYSQNVPVLVDFWATWCIPCRVLEPDLMRLTTEANGAFRLARVDVDESPKLAQRYNVRNIPVVKAINQGQVVSEFNGVLPEPRLRAFIRQLVPSPTDLTLEKGTSLLKLHQWSQAEETLRKYLEADPTNPVANLALARSLLALGRGQEVTNLLNNFPASREYNTAQLLRPLAEAYTHHNAPLADVDDPLEAAYRNSLRLALRGNIPAALDGLLDILRQNRRYRGGEIRQVTVSLLEILGDEDPLTRQYRTELATILF
jgi:putative thioredoxin